MISKKTIKKIAIFLAAYYILLGLILFIFQGSFVYYPDNADFDNCPGFKNAEKIEINGTRAYYKENSDKIIVFYHGNGGSACDREYFKLVFDEVNYSYLIPEYAGYSNDERTPSKKLLEEDVRNINEFLEEMSYSELILAGESMGTGLATYHSTITTSDKILLISPFDSIVDIAMDTFWFYPFPFLIREDYDNINNLEDYSGKLMIIHGEKDDLVPTKHGKNLFDSISLEDKEFVEIKDAGHNDLYYFKETKEAIYRFLT